MLYKDEWVCDLCSNPINRTTNLCYRNFFIRQFDYIDNKTIGRDFCSPKCIAKYIENHINFWSGGQDDDE